MTTITNETPVNPLGGLGKVFRNVLSLTTSDVINRATSFAIYILVGRYLGPFAFGQISLALSLFFSFQILATAGLKTFVVREVSRDITKTDESIVNSIFITAMTAIVTLMVLVVFVNVMGYNNIASTYLSSTALFTQMVIPVQENTAVVIFLICLGLLPFALSSIVEGIFQAHERMTFIAYVNVPANIARIVLVYLIVSSGEKLYTIAIMMLITHTAVLIVETYFLLRYISRPKLKFDLKFSMYLLKGAFTFFGMDAMLAIRASFYPIMISFVLSEHEVGIFSGATQLQMPFIIIYNSIVLAVFPIMCRRFDMSNPQSTKKIANILLELLLILAIPVSVGLIFTAETVLQFVYGDPEFKTGGTIVRITVLAILLHPIIAVLGRVLVANLREKKTLQIVLIDIVITFVLGFILIPTYGTVGAAISYVAALATNVFQHYLPVHKIYSGIPVIRIIWKPVVASAVMGAWLYLVLDQNIVLVVLSGALVYAAVLFALMFATIGGLKSIRAYYINI